MKDIDNLIQLMNDRAAKLDAYEEKMSKENNFPQMTAALQINAGIRECIRIAQEYKERKANECELKIYDFTNQS